MNDECKDALVKVRDRARKLGIESKLDDGLEYARTFSGGPEADWKTCFGMDIGFDVDNNPSFCFVVYRRLHPNTNDTEYLRRYMVIGMIWDEGRREWGFHS